MKYQCDKNHTFTFPVTVHAGTETNFIEYKRCPYCLSENLNISEYIEPIIEEETANVLVIELTTGPQIAIDKALSEGYIIKNRYAKNYVLEKPKATPQQAEDKFTEDAKAAYAKLHQEGQP